MKARSGQEPARRPCAQHAGFAKQLFLAQPGFSIRLLYLHVPTASTANIILYTSMLHYKYAYRAGTKSATYNNLAVIRGV